MAPRTLIMIPHSHQLLQSVAQALFRDLHLVQALTTADRKSTRLNSSHTEIYTLSLHDALPIYGTSDPDYDPALPPIIAVSGSGSISGLTLGSGSDNSRSEEHTSELQSHRDLHSFPTRRSSDLWHLGP